MQDSRDVVHNLFHNNTLQTMPKKQTCAVCMEGLRKLLCCGGALVVSDWGKVIYGQRLDAHVQK